MNRQKESETMMLNDVVNEESVSMIIDKESIAISSQSEQQEDTKVGEDKKIEYSNLLDINELEKISVSKDLDEIKVIVTLPYYLLKEFKFCINKKYGVDRNINFVLDDMVGDFNDNFGEQHHPTSSLSFGGKEPRKDVLFNLKKISEEFKYDDSFPTIYRSQLDKILKKSLGNVDRRTYNKYYNCIIDFVEKVTGQKLTYYSVCNVSGFGETILDRLTKLGSKGGEDT